MEKPFHPLFFATPKLIIHDSLEGYDPQIKNHWFRVLEPGGEGSQTIFVFAATAINF
jgi:hypothetical protein